MERYRQSNNSIIQNANIAKQSYMTQVYGWMSCGLLLTSIVAWYAYTIPSIVNLIMFNQTVFFILIMIQFGLVFTISNIAYNISNTFATSLFMLYSAITGLTLSSIFIMYSGESIFSTMVITSGIFGVMTLYGYTTKRDLSSFNSIFLMMIVGILLSSLINILLKSELLMWIITYISVIAFIGLTAYDTQRLKDLGDHLYNKDDIRRYSIIGALTLYLDFINLFLILLRITDRRK